LGTDPSAVKVKDWRLHLGNECRCAIYEAGIQLLKFEGGVGLSQQRFAESL
jgi:hypothetical protein